MCEQTDIAALRKPLYLHSASLKSLKLLGPALEVILENQSAQIFPLRRLRHLVLIGQAECDLSAILQLGPKGIPVCMMDARGNIQCTLLPAFNPENHYEAHFEALLYDQRVQSSAKHLADNFQRHALSCMAKQMELSNVTPLMMVKIGDHIRCTRSKGTKQTAEAWFDGLLLNQWQQILMHYHISPAGMIAEWLLPLVNKVCLPWRYVFIHDILIKQNNIATANSAGRSYQRVEDAIDTLLKRFFMQLDNTCRQFM